MKRGRLGILAAVAVLVVLFGGRWLALTFAEHAWFVDLGEGERHLALLARALRWQAALFAVAAVWFGVNSWLVYRSIGSVQLPRRVGDLEITQAVPRPVLRAIAVGIALVLAVATTITFRDLDQFVALYRAAVPLDPTEPVLGKDTAFYLARLPLLELSHLLATVCAGLALVLVAGLYALTGNLVLHNRQMQLTVRARSHLLVLLAALALVVAWGFRLDAFQLVGGGGHEGGALSAVDRVVRLPASNALAVVALLTAVVTVVSLRWYRAPVLVGLWATLAVATLLGRLLVPALAEAWRTGSDMPLSRELREYSDQFARVAFDLVDVRRIDYTAATEPRASDLRAAVQALEGLVPWAGAPGLFEASLTLPADTASPRLWTAGTAAYQMGPGLAARLVTVAVPQVDALRLTRSVPRPSWSQLHRGRYAWGGEAVAVDASLRAGAPRFLSRLEPLDTNASRSGLERAPGRIRFLPRPAELALVGPDEAAVGETPPGILLRHWWRRVLLAWALQSPPLMGRRTSVADRVLFWRDVPTRLAKLYRFAVFEPPLPVVANERLVWVSDGYLLSERFPLVPHIRWRGERINYLSAAYVATVDAVTGETRIYLRATANRFAGAVAAAEHVIALPYDSMPAELRRRLSYPPALFAAQVLMLARRGDNDSTTSRSWSLADRDTAEGAGDAIAVRSAMAVLPLDGGARPWLVSALTDAGGNRLTALVAGSLGPDGVPGLRLLRVRGLHPTPAAAATRLAAVAATIARGDPGAVRRGPVHVLPAGEVLVYAQVLFETDDVVNQPFRVAGVGALIGSRLGYGPDPAGAIASLGRGTLVVDQPGARALEAARAAFAAMDSARERGDWVAFGQAWDALRRALLLERAPQRQ